jgi:LacI family transcriptional regulator
MYSALEELKDFNFNGIFHVLISTSESEKNAEIKSVMKNMVDEGYSGIILLPNIDTRGIADLIKELKTQNVFVATIVSDIPQSERVFTVKGDGLSAGKMAAELMWWFCGKNPIAIFSGNSAVEIHKENLLGIEAMQNRFPLDILKVYENQDDAMIAYYATENLLREFPNVAGIYINSFNSITVCQKVIEAGLAGKIKIVTTDVSPEILDLIDKGVISATIFQNPYKQGKMAFRKLCDYITKSREGYGDILITPQIVMNSNKEHYSYNIIE